MTEAGMESTDFSTKAKNAGYVAILDTCGRSCALCQNTSNLQRCGRCFRVYYCSKDCQRLDWCNHRKACLEVAARAAANRAEQENTKPENGGSGDAKTSDEDVPSPGPHDICKHCKRTGDSFKTCSRCSSTTYCSKECQRKDWKEHKKDCKKIEKSKMQADYEAGKMFQEFARSLDSTLMMTTRRSSHPALSWKQAFNEAIRRNPGRFVMTKLSDVPEEFDLDPDMMMSTVFLARLVKPHPYVFRHAWYLEDRKGEQVRIFFYLDHDIPEPYFKWNQLDVGTYLCLEHAYIHMFMDLTTGIRVDDACCVQVIGD